MFSKKIEFFPSSEEVSILVDTPLPAKAVVPQWYKDAVPFDPSTMIGKNGVDTKLKMCMPFLDAITGGYIQRTWCDIHIKIEDGSIVYQSAGPLKAVSHRDKISIPINNNYYKLEFVWRIPWIPKLPDGYSMLITHPHNRLDLPFTTLSGIVDADKFHHVEFGQLPFYVNKDFEGIIPMGTPMFQIIPVKRDSWENVRREFNWKESVKKMYTGNLREFWGVYKNKFWQKKTYN
jgi:hypothetical protein